MTFWVLTADGDSVIMTSANVSVGGACLRPLTQRAILPPVGSRLQLCITTRTDVEELKNVDRGEVIRHTSDGIGVRFLKD